MASNSIAERIIQDVVSTLERVPSIKTVSRDWPGVDTIKQCAGTQLPYCAVLHTLPEPVEFGSDVNAYNRRVQSGLQVQVIVYTRGGDGRAATALSVADDVWSALLADPTRNGLAMNTKIIPEPELGDFYPIMAMRLDATVRYMHDGSTL